ncbi:MAG: ABC transporter substrate-binding protein [Alphaproteobacteria bacterium]|jgi:peptide/nickel transport system substrate-binding protein|nr:ABC transporter substrate-binding protein [Alphaproteobacteria bacterium]
MTDNLRKGWTPDRRTVLKTGAAMAGAAAVGGAMKATLAEAASPAGTMVIAAPATPQSLDCEFDVSLGTFEAIAACYDCVVEFEKIPDAGVPTARREDINDYPNKPGRVNLVGKLAESWEIDPDSQWIRFKLREGVMSNWGNELTADDVVWTWHRKLALGAIGGFYASVLSYTRPEMVRKESKYVVSFNLDNPNPLLMKLQPNLYNPIFDSTKCAEAGGSEDPWAKEFLKNNTAGFGPYEIAKLVRGNQAVYKARADYYGGKPAIDTVIFKEVPTTAARAQLLEGGAVDIAQHLQPLELVKLAKVPGVTVDTIPATFMLWIELNAKMKPFDNIDVRRAMNFAFPQEQVISTVFQNLAEPLTACMPDIYAGYNKSYWEYGKQDLAQAKELLKGAGYPDGFETTLAYDASSGSQETSAILYQSALREIGVKLKLKKIPAATFYSNVSERKQPMIFYLDSPWCPDAGYSMNLYFHSKSFINYSNYENARVDELIDAASKTGDMDARLEMMDEVQKHVMREAPWVFVAKTNFSLAHRADLKGWTYYTSNNMRFQDFHR